LISKINHTDKIIAKQIQFVFQNSYAVEAKILKAVDFPPLQRKLDQYTFTDTSFYAYLNKDEFAGIVEIKKQDTYIHIQSLVVMPKYFRQGIAQQLLDYIYNKIPSKKYVVETGIGNIPAVNLYLKNGFVEVDQWDTDFGIRKVRYEKKG